MFLCLAVVVFVFLPVLWWGWISLVSLSCGCDGLGGSLCLVVWGRLPSPSPCVLSGRGRGQMFLLLAAVLAKTEKLIFCCDVSHFSGLGESAPPQLSRREGEHCDCDVCCVLSLSCRWGGSLLFLCLAVVVFCVILVVLWWWGLSCVSVLRLWWLCFSLPCGGGGWVPLVSLSCGCGGSCVFRSCGGGGSHVFLCVAVVVFLLFLSVLWWGVGASCFPVLRLWCVCVCCSLSCGGGGPSCFPALRL